MQFLFPNEILQLILANLSTRDLFRLKLVNRQFRQIIKQIEIGQLSQVQLSFPDNNQQFDHICKSANYLLFDHYLHIFKDNISLLFWFQSMNASCLSGDYHIPDYLIKKYQKSRNPACHDIDIVINWNASFVGACQSGNIELVKKLIKLGADDWNWGLEGACAGGHIEIVKFMIEKLRQFSIEPNWDWGFDRACRYGHMEIVKFMLEKMKQLMIVTNWNWGLAGACLGGHIEIVKLMIEKIKQSMVVPNWNWGLVEACGGKHIEIVKLMISNGATQCDYCHKPIFEH